ncbi:galactose-binding domain-like protein [Chytriomyces sp. MP71]|nr:galactose-binding domain-like protein [Chytriomyces sp. MP71]KAI8619929.1 galactose-binding domain-like protein [Chytriomyces sp. MP71]
MSHSHSHDGSCGHEAHDHDHEHDHDSPDRGGEFTLFQFIDVEHVRAYNEAVDGSAKTIFKAWDQRLDETQVLESDADEQLILFIPFTGSVKLKSIAVRGVGEHSPSEMKVFINREDIDFSNVDSIQAWDQEWELIDPTVNSIGTEIPEYPTRLTKFGQVRNLTLFFPGNVSRGSEEITKIVYIGLKGEWTEINRDPIITIYELAANPADHKKIGAADENTHAIQ